MVLLTSKTAFLLGAKVPSPTWAVDTVVVAINTATYWHALRTFGIKDKISGFGRLLEDY